MGKSAPKQPTEQTVTQTNVPDWLKPSVLDVVGRAQGVASQEYTPYPNQRIAGFTPAQEQIQQKTLDMQGPNQFAFGSNLAAAAGQGSLSQAQYTPSQFSAQQLGQPNLQQHQMQGAERFGQQQANQYMSPYMQSVVDIQKREAIRDADKTQLSEDLGAARQGTYGGSRQLLANLERERNLGQNLGDIQQRGSQSAFENAQAQYERDRAAKMGADQTNLQARLGTQELGTNAGLQALMANQQYDMDAQRYGEQSRQFGAQQGLAAYGQAGELGQTLGNLGQYQQNADLQRLGAQGQTAALQQSQEQMHLDQMYADFLRQRDYPQEQLSFYNNIIRGLPAGQNSSSITYAQQPSVANQILGTGLGALGVYKNLQGGG